MSYSMQMSQQFGLRKKGTRNSPLLLHSADFALRQVDLGEWNPPIRCSYQLACQLKRRNGPVPSYETGPTDPTDGSTPLAARRLVSFAAYAVRTGR